MKYLLLIGALFTATQSSYAQNGCRMNHPIFRFDQAGEPKEVRTLGTAPQFPFIANLSTPQQVLAAMKRNDEHGGRGSSEMNRMLREIGFRNGIRDVKASNIESVTLPSGTTGNMGSSGNTQSYTRLTGGGGFKAWKVSADNGCYMYFLARCGNSFAMTGMNDGDKTAACREVPVNINSEAKTVTLGGANAARTTEKKSYVYYHDRKEVSAEDKMARRAIPDDNPSSPLLLRRTTKTEVIPQEYRVSVTPADGKATVCNDKPVDVDANINVEFSSAYTGNYPTDMSDYKEVSKRVYKKSMRKLMKAEKKEAKVEAMTGITVDR